MKRSSIKSHILFNMLLLTSLPLFVGCSHLLGKSNETPAVTPEEVQMESGYVNARPEKPVEDAPTYASMDAQTMYQLVVAEMLVQRGQYADAFSLMMPIAEKRREPELTERVFQLAMQSYDLNAMKKATALLKEVEPDKLLTWQAAYLLSVQDGDIEQAVAEWQKYVGLAKNELSANANAVESQTMDDATQFDRVVFQSANRVTQTASETHGLAFLNALREIYPDSASITYSIGVAALNYRNYALAHDALWQAEKRYALTKYQTLYRDIYLKLTNVYLGLNQPEEGLEKLAHYLKNNPQDWRFQEQYARLEVKAGRFDKAISRYTEIVKQSPNSYTSRLSLALLKLERKEYQEAENLLNPLLNQPAYQSFSLYYLGIAKKEQRDLKQARLMFNQITQGEFYIDAQLQLAEIDYPQIGLDETLKNLEKLQATAPEDQLKLYRAKAIFYKTAGNEVKAIENYDNALKLVPNNIDLMFAQAVIFYDQNNFDAYEQRLKNILAVDANQVDALNALGYLYTEQNKNLDEAEVLLDKALSLAPNQYYVLDSKGWLRYTQQRYQEAESLLERAFTAKLDDEVLIHLIKTKWQLKKYDEANALWESYANQFPDNAQLQSLLQSLKKK